MRDTLLHDLNPEPPLSYLSKTNMEAPRKVLSRCRSFQLDGIPMLAQGKVFEQTSNMHPSGDHRSPNSGDTSGVYSTEKDSELVRYKDAFTDCLLPHNRNN